MQALEVKQENGFSLTDFNSYINTQDQDQISKLKNPLLLQQNTMAKFPVPCKDKRAQKMITSFSELEIDLVWLLVQMSNSDGRLIQLKNNKKDDAEHRSYEGDASNLPSLFHAISEEEEEEIYPMRRNKRSRSIDHIYQVTEPVLQGFVCSKKKRLSC